MEFEKILFACLCESTFNDHVLMLADTASFSERGKRGKCRG